MSECKQPSWLRNAIFYQIYPQSFCDSNGDGIGDLAGIVAKLDYIRSIGCDAIWLTPVFESPFHDAGYDISDFLRVAPRYGTNDDLVGLFRAAHERGLRVVLDLVAGHTSVEHPWFKESARAERNAWSDRYLWIEPVWRDAPPELRTINGYSERNGSFVTNFFWCQPALNYGWADPDPAHPWEKPLSHPACRETLQALKDVMTYWLECGADGFRIDMAQSIVRAHDPAKKYDALKELWTEVRAWFDRDYPEAVLIAEWSEPKQAINAGFHVDFMIHFGTVAYNALFRNHREELITGLPRGNSFFDRRGNGDIQLFLRHFFEHYTATKGRGYISVPTGNHDTPPRLAEERTPAELECALLTLLTLPGIPFIYYGDEIGMKHHHGLVSKEGGYERTGTRTPMPWDDSRNAGFSSAPAESLYLPVDGSLNVAAAERDPSSPLHFVRRLNHWRKTQPALGSDGEFETLFAEEGRYPFVFVRFMGDDRFWIAVNPSSTPVAATWASEAKAAESWLAQGATLTLSGGEARIELAGAGYGLWKVAKS